jgi:hypothetical protein
MPRKRLFNHDAILADYLAGMSNTDIAAKYGCAGNLGCQLAKRRGLSRSPKVVAQVNRSMVTLSLAARENSPLRIRLLAKHKRIAEYAKRHGIAATAIKFEYSENGVRDIAKQHGWNPSQKRFDRQAILQDYLDGMKLLDIAAKHGCNPVYPSQLAKRAGKLRNKSGKRA